MFDGSAMVTLFPSVRSMVLCCLCLYALSLSAFFLTQHVLIGTTRWFVGTRQTLGNDIRTGAKHETLGLRIFFPGMSTSSPPRNRSLCPLLPPNLVGRLNISYLVPSTEVIRNLRYGGTYLPPDCLARERTAVIIPYRDRPEHLYTTVYHLHAVLQRQQLHYGIYVIEMELPTQFNRGILANIGIATASSVTNYTCYVIHDVDLLPLDDRNLYRCDTNPRHLVTSNSKFGDGKLPYSGYVGGVLAMTPGQFLKINGFSNLFFGWGGEDDDIWIRCRTRNMTFERPDHGVGAYLALNHTGDASNPPNPHKLELLKETARRMRVDGLNSLRYSRRALEFRQAYTWVLVHVVESEIMQEYSNITVRHQVSALATGQRQRKTVVRPQSVRADKTIMSFTNRKPGSVRVNRNTRRRKIYTLGQRTRQ